MAKSKGKDPIGPDSNAKQNVASSSLSHSQNDVSLPTGVNPVAIARNKYVLAGDLPYDQFPDLA